MQGIRRKHPPGTSSKFRLSRLVIADGEKSQNAHADVMSIVNDQDCSFHPGSDTTTHFTVGGQATAQCSGVSGLPRFLKATGQHSLRNKVASEDLDAVFD